MQVRVLHSVAELAPESWDALCPDPVFSHGWFRALERCGIVRVEPRHLIVEEEGEIRAILPCFIHHDDPYYALPQRLFGPLAGIARRIGLGVAPALLAYSPLAHRTELFTAPGTDRERAARACGRRMLELCREERIPVCGWYYVSGWEPAEARALHEEGFQSAFLAPSAFWANRFESFDAYVDSFRKVGRRRHRSVRHELNRTTRSGVQLESVPLGAVDDETLAALQRVRYGRFHPGVASPFSPEFFRALREGLGDRAVLHTARRDDELLSYSIVLAGSERWTMFLSGDVDEARAHADGLHFALNYYFPIRRAIEEKVERLDYGLSTYRMKLLRGCELEPVQILLRANAPLLRAILPLWLRVVDRRYRYKSRDLPVSARTELGVAVRSRVARAPRWRRWLRVLAERHDFIVTSTSIDQVASRRTSTAGIRVRPLVDDDLARLDATASRTGRQLFQRFREAGYRCWVAWEGGRLAGYLWVTDGACHCSAYFGWLPLREGESFVGFTYVAPEQRGRGISRRLKEHAAAELAVDGARVLYSGVLDSNVDSLKSNARLGASPVGIWRYRRLGPFERRASGEVSPEHPVYGLFEAERSRTGAPPLASERAPVPLGWDPPTRGASAASWTPAEPVWRQARAYLRARGAGELAREVVRRLSLLVWERSTIIELSIPLGRAPAHEVPQSEVHPEIELLDRRALPLLHRLASRDMYRQFVRFAREGYDCWVARVDGHVVAYNWFTDRPYWSDDLGTRFGVEEGEVFSVFSHTSRAWRGHGLNRAIRRVAFDHYRRAGYVGCRALVEDRNRASLWMNLRWGGVPCRQYRYRRILRSRRCIAEPLEPTPDLFERLLGERPVPYGEGEAPGE